MSAVAPEVDFILTAIDDNYGSPLADVPLQRIDRDNAENIDTGERLMAETDYTANFVGAKLASKEFSAVGTEYDARIETVVNVRLSGTHHSEHGEVDPDGVNGAVWYTMKNNVRRAILTEREFPTVPNRPNMDYCWIDQRNEQDLSSEFKDKFRWTADYVLVGFETNP